MNLKADESLIKATHAVVKWDKPPHADVYELSDYTVQRKPALDNNAVFTIEKSVDADVTELKLTGLKPDTAYLVRVVSHRKNAQKEGVSKTLEIITIKGAQIKSVKSQTGFVYPKCTCGGAVVTWLARGNFDQKVGGSTPGPDCSINTLVNVNLRLNVHQGFCFSCYRAFARLISSYKLKAVKAQF